MFYFIFKSILSNKESLWLLYHTDSKTITILNIVIKENTKKLYCETFNVMVEYVLKFMSTMYLSASTWTKHFRVKE